MTTMPEWGNALKSAAENFANNVDHRGLDFTFHSLGRLDEVLVQATQKPELFSKAFVGLWSYVGEVLIRQYGCRWGTEDGQDAKVIGDLRLLPPGDAASGSQPIKPMDLLTERFARDIAIPDLVLEIATPWYTPPAEGSISDGVVDMRRVADVFVATAKGAGQMWLDYSPESVLRLDDFIDENWGARPKRDAYEAMIPTIGAYVGEVIVAQTGALWKRSDDGGMAVELGRISAFPMNKVAKRFERGREHSIAQFYRELMSHWSSGNDTPPATWKPFEPAKPQRSLFGLRRK